MVALFLERGLGSEACGNCSDSAKTCDAAELLKALAITTRVKPSLCACEMFICL